MLYDLYFENGKCARDVELPRRIPKGVRYATRTDGVREYLVPRDGWWTHVSRRTAIEK